jgi:hypothetical protein
MHAHEADQDEHSREWQGKLEQQPQYHAPKTDPIITLCDSQAIIPIRTAMG